MNGTYKTILKVSLIWVCLIIVGFFIIKLPEEKQAGGLRIGNNYIESISEKEAYVNDIYITTMINFVDNCNLTTLNRFNDMQRRLNGITLWCRNTSNSFTFFYSDKWGKEQYGTK